MMQPNKQLNDIRAMGQSATFSSFLRFTSSSRNAMATSQSSQALVVEGSEPSRSMTGLESQMAEYCFGAKAPCTMRIIDVIQKYPGRFDQDGNSLNPKTTIIFQDLDADDIRYDTLDVEAYHSTHDKFGHKNVKKYEDHELHHGKIIEKGELLSHSTNIKDGIYSIGVMAEVCFLSLPGVIEDGFIASESFMDKCKTKAVESRVLEFGKEWVPLNLYGTPENPRAFPDIGEKIRPDGILFGRRKKDEFLDAIDMTPEALMMPDPFMDDLVYASPEAMVYDIDVLSSSKEGRHQTTPELLGKQANHHADISSNYHARILEFWRRTKENNEGHLISPALLTLIEKAIADKPDEAVRRPTSTGRRASRINRTWRASPLDEFRVEVSFEYTFVPRESAKLTTQNGGKGVVCSIWKDEDMPIDDNGNRAEIIIFGRAAFARLIPSSPYEQFVNAASRDVSKTVRGLLENGSPKEALDLLTRYYDIVSPPMASALRLGTEQLIGEHLEHVRTKGIHLIIPPDNDWIGIDTYRKVCELHPPSMTPVTYTNPAGKAFRTKSDVLIGGMYMLVLEKSDPKSMACSGPRLQHHGLPATSSKASRDRTPTKEQAARVFGESEVRALSGSIGGEAISHILDLTTNPAAHRQGIRTVMSAKNPSRIPMLVNRKEIPLGNSRPVAATKHTLETFGVVIADDEK